MFPAWMKFDKEQTESDADKERPSLFIFKKIRDPQKGSFEPQRERRKVGRSFGGSGSIATNKMRGW